MKKLLATLIVIGTVLSAAPAIGEEDKQSFFPASLQLQNPAPGEHRVFSIGDDAGVPFSQLGNWPDRLCKSTADPNCDFEKATVRYEDGGISANAVLGQCTAASNDDCIESIEISRDATTYSKLTFERFIPGGFLSPRDGNSFPADLSRELPEGTRASIWSESVDGKVSDLKYIAYYLYGMNYDPQSKIFNVNNVSLSIRPFKEISGNRWDALWEGEGQNGIQYDFKENTTMRMTVHMSNRLGGWFKARMKDVNIEISPLNNRNSKVVVSGSAVTVPNFAEVRALTSMSAKEAELAKHFGYMKGVVEASPGERRIFEYLEYWRPIVKDVALYSNTYWTLNSTRWTSSNKCLQDTSRVLGVVSTNAMGFDGNAPAFVDGFLNYRVAGLHYAADGKTENLGTYDLVMRSDAARCLYGFSNAPVSATVSITGADGSSNVATTVVTEKNGWLKMKAAGFTFSEKNIKVKLTQEASAKVKKVTITCVKGKSSKKVSAVNPKCPAGFKKK
jgi:hypothetical protein